MNNENIQETLSFGGFFFEFYHVEDRGQQMGVIVWITPQ